MPTAGLSLTQIELSPQSYPGNRILLRSTTRLTGLPRQGWIRRLAACPGVTRGDEEGAWLQCGRELCPHTLSPSLTVPEPESCTSKCTVALLEITACRIRYTDRSLSRYYQPKPSDHGQGTGSETPSKSRSPATKRACPDTALTAFCQLVAWRTGAERALLR